MSVLFYFGMNEDLNLSTKLFAIPSFSKIKLTGMFRLIDFQDFIKILGDRKACVHRFNLF